MSDAYEINGVTITPQAGGYYQLTHSSLAEPVRERGREAAEARAAAIAEEAAAEENGSMAPQGDLPATPPAPPAPAASDPRDDEIAALKAKIAELSAVRTVVADAPADSPTGKVPASVPREYRSILDDAAKARLRKLGTEVTDIILEENEVIPPTGLYLGHNGRGYMIVPGEPVTVPNFLLSVLDTAVMSSPTVDSKTQKIVGYRNRMRYPYRRI